MGPCWLEVKGPSIVLEPVQYLILYRISALTLLRQKTWCKFEAKVTDPKDINPIPESDPSFPKEIPPLTVMSLSVRTIVNHTANKREIVCASARTWANSKPCVSCHSDNIDIRSAVDIEDPTPPDQQVCTVQSFVRPLDKFPAKFQQIAQDNKKGVIWAEATERVLLNRLLSE
jgi:DNA polymerase alpha subunit A